MKFFSLYLPLVAIMAGSLFSGAPLLGQTATETKVRKLPFHGKLLSVDQRAQTITLAGKTARTFHLTSITKVTDGSGNPSTLSAAVVGEDVGGSYTKDAAGTMTLYSVRFGAKTGTKTSPASTTATSPPAQAPPPSAPAAAPSAGTAPAATAPAPAAAPRKLTFSGKVVSVDSAANTVVIHGRADRTFALTSTTKVTDASGNAANLSGVAAGTKVSGTYSKSPDGTLTVYTLKVVP